VDTYEISKSEIAQAYGIPLSTQSTYLKTGDYIDQQALQGDDILKCRRICGAKLQDLCAWFCHAWTVL
jgi:hypothetical protein